MGEYMTEYHKQNNITFVKSKKLIGSYFGKEILLYTPLLKWYLQHGLKSFHSSFFLGYQLFSWLFTIDISEHHI
jgi:hypothetical protein